MRLFRGIDAMSDKKDSTQAEGLNNKNNNSSIDLSSQNITSVNKPDAAMLPVAAKRRELLKAALAAPPVLMSLTSRPVHAVQGLSNMLSGDSSQCRGDVNYGGMSPGFWKKLVGSTDVYGDSAADAWMYTGYEYGTLIDLSKPNKWDSYAGGTLYDDAFGSGYPGKTFREILNEPATSGSEAFHLVAGLLNARYFEYKAGAAGTQYFMTTAQFWSMYEGRSAVPSGYASLRDLIESSYHLGPGSDCP